ncbi:uncharacterized protein LOC118741439 [Rhagoletis pomonella]|uniref:uncharacterized protein LOC118741439 n=1 Tax=Rhagoletis pomonella TaxID=28610 RepID=UPI001786B3CF|nr:uncharacterized protein LOC118741439 [Rhagoletis pomonella]XP_036329303.1 uncharacterized protein LOC118741439 [Rhagoletis pomonella]XP_036329304.1 uncharacterized protein LOC118741439 [Rhagoletis pomonella]
MIIVLLLLFQSLCLYCQRLVLHIHDRWINPKNSRLLKEAAETSSAATRKLLLEQYHTGRLESNKQTRKRNSTSACGEPDGSAGGILAEACRFCANSPQGYCRHHFHLQELELRKAQQNKQVEQSHPLSQYRPRFWQPLCGGNSTTALEHTWAQRRQQRKVNRELKRNLKNRLCATTSLQQQQQQPQQLQHPMQKQFQLNRQYLRRQQYEESMRARNAGTISSSSSSSSGGSPLWDTSTSNSSSGHQSPFAAVYNVNGSLTDIDTTDSGLATSLESVAYYGAEEQESIEESPPVLEEKLTPNSTITTTHL